ncbi:B3/B4 domain-containing protein [Chitiniphilus eburneus]|nr:B3/4 domain-containing protein [Chitiniphilus eburneus]
MIEQVHISTAAAMAGVANACVARISGVTVFQSRHYERHLLGALQQIVDDKEFMQRPEITGYQQQLGMLGFAGTRPANERLIHHFMSNGPSLINNVVDSYNVASLLFGASIGGHVADGLDGCLEIDIASGGETITPLFSRKARRVAPGSLVYSSGGRLLAAIGGVDTDADPFKIDESARDVILVVLGHQHTSYRYNYNVARRAADLLTETNPGSVFSVLPTIINRQRQELDAA